MSNHFNPMVLSAQYSEIPDELTSSERKKPIPLSVKTQAIPSQSGTANSGGQVLFQLNSSSGFIKPGSMYMRCKITVTNGTTRTANTILAWGNACRNASAIIDRFTVSSGAVLESINNYGSKYVPDLLLQASNQPYLQGDDSLLEGRKRPVANADGAAADNSIQFNGWVDVPAAAAAGFNSSVDVAIPMYSNLFNNEKAYPLCLLAQNTLIQLDLATLGKAFYCASGTATDRITEFQVSSAQLIYDLITPSPEYLMMLKQELAQGMLYQVPFVSALCTTYAKQGLTSSIQWGVGLSSLKGVTYSAQVAPSTLTDPKYFLSDNVVGGVLAQGGNFRLFLDGQQQSSTVQDTTAVRYAHQQNVFGLLTDVVRTSGSGGIIAFGTTDYTVTPLNYESVSFVGGQTATKINECMAMTGSQVNNVSFILDTLGNAGTVLLCCAWHDRIMVVDANGSASIIL